jgi:hypothetical protein
MHLQIENGRWALARKRTLVWWMLFFAGGPP